MDRKAKKNRSAESRDRRQRENPPTRAADRQMVATVKRASSGFGRGIPDGRLIGTRDWLFAAGILFALLFIYQPAWHGGLLWDDNEYVTRATLQSWHGLYRIWFDVGATAQYYPLLHTAFWLEHQLWGDATLGYHLVKIAQHALATVLVLIVLRRLAYTLQGQLDAAIDHFQQALAIRPDNAEAHNNLAVLLAQRGDLDRAIEHYRQALEIKPDYIDARQNLAAALAEQRKTKKRPPNG